MRLAAENEQAEGTERTAGTSGGPSRTVTEYSDNAVLTGKEMREALRLSARQWSRIAPLLPQTTVLGRRSVRFIYGDVVEFLRKQSIRMPT
ncbi:MAG: hypothetical protein ACYCVL_10590 [Gemmatimonadaceae bacterium]